MSYAIAFGVTRAALSTFGNSDVARVLEVDPFGLHTGLLAVALPARKLRINCCQRLSPHLSRYLLVSGISMPNRQMHFHDNPELAVCSYPRCLVHLHFFLQSAHPVPTVSVIALTALENFLQRLKRESVSPRTLFSAVGTFCCRFPLPTH